MNNLKNLFPSIENKCEIQTIMDMDYYKILMLDFILQHDEYKNLEVKWRSKVRSKNIKTAKIIPLEDLKNQLELTKNLPGISVLELEFLKSQKLENGKQAISDMTLDYLKNYKFSDYSIEIDENDNYVLEFTGTRGETILWEIFGLKILNALYNKNYILKDNLDNAQISQIITQTLDRLYKDIEIFSNTTNFSFTEFGTRRAFSAPFQEKVFAILQNEIPQICTGTSNIMLAQKFNTPVIGTNAHELRMIPTALYDTKEEIIAEMYDIDRKWMKHFPGKGLLLPDTYGTSFYLDNCPKDILENHNGVRIDSKDPLIAIPEYVDKLLKNEIKIDNKIAMCTDGLDAENATNIFKTDFGVKQGFGIGTNISNNTKGTYPIEAKHGSFGSFSVVIKPYEVKRPDGTWVKCVKLSDNPEKAIGGERAEFFKEIFGVKGVEKREVEV